MKPGALPTSWTAASLHRRLGLSPVEAKRLYAASRKPTNDMTALKQQLMVEITNWINQHCLKQAEAAEILKVSRPRVSDVVNKKASKFTIDALVDMLSRVGKPVTLSVGEGKNEIDASASPPARSPPTRV